MRDFEVKSKSKWAIGLSGIVLFVLVLGAVVRSSLGSSYTQNKTLVYPVLLICFQYGTAIYGVLGALIVFVSGIRLKQIGYVLPLLGLSIYVVVGILQLLLTYPALEHRASIHFKDKTYHIVEDSRYEEDSMPVPTAYLVFQCEFPGITCRRSQLLFRDRSLDDKRNYQPQRLQRKVDFVINYSEIALYATIDEQLFKIKTGIPIEEEF
jgi:hypothetical protein